jgi:hypothetical protein
MGVEIFLRRAGAVGADRGQPRVIRHHPMIFAIFSRPGIDGRQQRRNPLGLA